MGEVRVKVMLANALDKVLVRRGQLEPAEVHSYEPDALVDTGTVRCVLPPFVADRLDLGRVGQ